MTITMPVAKTAAEYLKAHATPEAAAHQVRVQLTALGSYSSSHLEAVAETLRFCGASSDPAKNAKRCAALLAMAGN